MVVYSILESVPRVRRGMGALVEDRQKTRRLRAFMMRVGHELRNRINSILCT